MMARKIFLTLLTLLIVVCIGLSVVLIPGTVLLVTEGANQPPSSDSSSPDLSRPLPTLPADQETLPEAIRAQMDEIQQQVIQLRGLFPKEALQRDLLTGEQLREQVIHDFFEDYTPKDAELDARLLSAFGLLQPGTDLYALYIDLYSEQVAGYYDPETKEMFVIEGGGFTGLERMTYAHEYTHALQDQYYGLQTDLQLNDEHCEIAAEYCAAIQALIEGDATLAELLWFGQYSTDQDKQDIQEFYESYQSPVYDSAPQFMKEDFLFPYAQGQEFVQSLYDLGGWLAVDQAYVERPVSTEQILHPDLYPDEQPVAVEAPDLAAVLADGWEELDRSELGEWYTFLLLAHGWEEPARQSLDQSKLASAGWGGDAYVVYENPAEEGLVLAQHWAWDQSQDADEFWQVFKTYGQSRWGSPALDQAGQMSWQETSDGWVTILRQGIDVYWVIAPDATTTDSILQSLNLSS